MGRRACSLPWVVVDGRGVRRTRTDDGGERLAFADGRVLFAPSAGNNIEERINRSSALDLLERRPATRVRLDRDSIVVVAAMHLSHADDRAILAAFGMNVEAEIAKRRDDAEWSAPGWSSRKHASGRMITTFDGRLTSTIEITERLRYHNLTFTHRGDLPAATVASMSGRPLSDVIDIPELRDLDLRIRSAERGDNLCLPDDQAHVSITVGDEDGWTDIG